MQKNFSNVFIGQALVSACKGNVNDLLMMSVDYLYLSRAITSSYTQVTTFEHVENCKMCSCVTISVFESTIKYLDLQLLRREWYMHDTLMVSNL